MRIEEARAVLEELGASTTGFDVHTGIRGSGRGTYAYLTLTALTDAGKVVTLSTPGLNWFELEVPGGFLTGRTDDRARPDDVREYLEFYFSYAIAYQQGRWTLRKTRILRRPVLEITSDRGTLRLGINGSANHGPTAGW